MNGYNIILVSRTGAEIPYGTVGPHNGELVFRAKYKRDNARLTANAYGLNSAVVDFLATEEISTIAVYRALDPLRDAAEMRRYGASIITYQTDIATLRRHGIETRFDARLAAYGSHVNLCFDHWRVTPGKLAIPWIDRHLVKSVHVPPLAPIQRRSREAASEPPGAEQLRLL